MSSTSSSRESWLGLWRFARIFALVERLWSKRGTFTYVGLMGCAAFLGILRLFALGKLLPKDEFGTYSFIVLAIQYIAPLASLGVVEGVAQWLPQALGRNDRGEALQIRAHGFSMLCMLTGCLSAIWISGVGISQYLGFESGNLAVAGFGSCMLFLIYSFVLRDIRSQLKRGWFSGLMFAKAASDVALSVMVTWRYGAIGIVAGDCVVYLGLIAMAWFFCMPKGQWICKPSYAMAKRLIGTGLTISIAGLIVNTDILGDRLFLSWGSSKGEFACYAFHALLLAAGLTASSMIYQYQLPALLHAFGQHGNAEQIHRSTCRSFARVLVVGLAIAPIAVGTLGFVIHGWFPQYQFSIWLAVPLALSAVIEAANLFPLAVTTVGQHRGLLFGRLATAISGSILYGIALWSGARGEWYAAILLLTRMASLVICYVMSVRFCMLRRDEDGCSSLVAST